jgi:hypothetical protein
MATVRLSVRGRGGGGGGAGGSAGAALPALRLNQDDFAGADAGADSAIGASDSIAGLAA